MLLLNTAIKWADLNHCSKPLALHELWTNRITNEFWVLGDKERKLGVPVSPLCSRETDNNIAKSQVRSQQRASSSLCVRVLASRWCLQGSA
eukprot:367896-Prymnesium_polylepis.2